MKRNSQTDSYSDDLLEIIFGIFELIGAISGIVVSCLSASPIEPLYIQILYAIYFSICGMIIAGVVFIGLSIVVGIITFIISLFT